MHKIKIVLTILVTYTGSSKYIVFKVIFVSTLYYDFHFSRYDAILDCDVRFGLAQK